jgi:hypothetical protein
MGDIALTWYRDLEVAPAAVLAIFRGDGVHAATIHVSSY